MDNKQYQKCKVTKVLKILIKTDFTQQKKKEKQEVD